MSRVIGKQTAEDSAYFIVKGNVSQLNNLLKNVTKNDDDILYIFVENNNRRVVAYAFKKGFYLSILNNILNINDNTKHLSTIKLVSTEYGRIYDTAAPILNGKLGIVRVGASLSRAEKLPLLLIRSIIIITIFMSILVIILFGSITWWITIPVVKLLDATKKVKKGDYDVKINIPRDDDMGKLSKAFNEMALNLKEAENERIENEKLRKNFISSIINAQEEERKSISRNLHDILGQFLSYLKIKLRMLDDINNLDEIKSKIYQIRGDLTEGFTVIHDIAKNLRPSILDEMGLSQAINLYIGDIIKNNPDIKIEFYPVNLVNQRFDKNIEINIYRIIQEAVLNILRHACAHSIKIILENYEQKIRGIIEDNGAGFECRNENKEYLGINGMKERANLLGGELTVESEINLGTVVKFYVPVENYSSEEGDNKGDNGNYS
jgi:signal transduction histidine kinase